MDSKQLVWLFFGASGRVSRQPYALAGLFLYLLRAYPVYRILSVPNDDSAGAIWGGVLLIMTGATLVGHIMLTIKRLHDLNLPGWGAIAMILLDALAFAILCFIPGTSGPNRFGARTNAPS